MRCAHLAPSHVRDGINKGSLGTLTETRIEAKASEGESTEVVDTVVRPTGLEPVTPRSVVWCSIH